MNCHCHLLLMLHGRSDIALPVVRWYSYLNFIRFSWGAVMVNQFADSKPQFLPGYTVSLLPHL